VKRTKDQNENCGGVLMLLLKEGGARNDMMVTSDKELGGSERLEQ